MYRALRLKQAEVAEATNVENGASAVGVCEQCLVESRNQRCTLAAGRYIATAKVADDADAGELDQQGRVADLDAEATAGLVAHGLTMAADGANTVCGYVVLLQVAH